MEEINVEQLISDYHRTAVPIRSWAVNAEEGAIEQAVNLAQLPFAISHIALMPDAHQGYGMPIGGVLFADKAVVPYAVGVDIGCGVQLLATDATIESHAGDFQEDVNKLLAQIYGTVPAGNGPPGEHANHNMINKPTFWDSNPVVATNGVSDNALGAILGAEKQLGTLGGGNHFLELQKNKRGEIFFMLHSGSRSVGKKICDYWHKIALEMNEKYFSQLPHKELAYLPWETEEAHGYFNDMTLALAWAEENRRRMASKVIAAFGELGVSAWPVTDVHHNYAAWENHLGRNGIVHRKGAVRANAGETVLIPGSMGTSSWVATGLGNPLSFNTCQHGAGRLRSRGATRRLTTVEEMDKQLESVGVTLVTKSRESVIDESTVAYKDIDEVMAASSDLITPFEQLFPIGVVKG